MERGVIISTSLRVKEAYMGNWLHLTVTIDTEKKTVQAFGKGAEVIETVDVQFLNALAGGAEHVGGVSRLGGEAKEGINEGRADDSSDSQTGS